jgi:hypothetical protein
VVLVSSHDSSDFGPLVARSGACGFVSKDELSASTIEAVLARMPRRELDTPTA